jgi:D-amino-acid dehydrogenase
LKVAVIGAGIIGVTTAYELASDGHEVTVFERHGSPAEETSFANAGVVAPGYASPWAAPGMPAKVLRLLLSRHSPVKLGWPLTAHELSWMWQWRRACKLDAYLANRARMQRLAFYSLERLQWLTDSLQLDYERSPGLLVLLRTEKDMRMMQPGLQVLREAGVGFHEIDAQTARQVEPALNPDTDFSGAVHLPEDEVANCRQFAIMLKKAALALGVDYQFNTTVAPLDPARPATLWVRQGEQPARQETFHAVVVCGGVESAALLRPLGLKLPLVSVHGYSVTAPIRELVNAPRSAVIDERYKVAISRLGQRVRVSGGAEIGGRAAHKRAQSIETLYNVLHDWFPGAAQLANTGAAVQEWKGARPMLPDGPPVLGAVGVAGVWINLGHGSSGWALSCGSARVIADLMNGHPPLLDIEGLGIERLAA